ncbi:MAG TPA: PH domain-containing protein [Anaerolineales bacterium]|jgi:uncharacterized membrane protein YdbT with pleckstrin-like domain|nr:PH domain-containing protein [Anaerolineales bacterium]
MGYVEQNLMPGEQVVLKAKLHWAMFLGPAIIAGIGFLLLMASAASRTEATAGISCLAGLVFLLGLVYAFRAVISYFTTEFAVTNKRVLAKTGLLRRRSLELLLGKVESIGVSQPILGRILNYGTIVVVGTGGTKEGFPNIAAPMDFRKRVHIQIAEPA